MAEIGQGHARISHDHREITFESRGIDDAVRELEGAAQADPKLPLVHYYLGMTYVRKQDYERARVEFHKDLTVEPDAAFTYEQLGKVEFTLQNEGEAAKDFGLAVKLDPGWWNRAWGWLRSQNEGESISRRSHNWMKSFASTRITPALIIFADKFCYDRPRKRRP